MAAYVILANFTDQGIRNVKDTVKRSETFKELAKKKDATVRDIFWTLVPTTSCASLMLPTKKP